MQLMRPDLERVVRRIPRPLRRLMETWWPPLVVAGGFVRGTIAGEEVSDIDVFGAKEQVDRAISILATDGVRTIETENATTILGIEGRGGESLPIQVVQKWPVDDPFALVRHFDFSVCAAAVWRDAPTGDPSAERRWDSYAADAFYPDLAARRLRFQRPQGNTAGGTLLRTLRFASRGYRISPEDLAAVVAEVMTSIAGAGAPPSSLEEAILRELREVDPGPMAIDGEPLEAEDPVPTKTAGDGAKTDEDDDVLF